MQALVLNVPVMVFIVLPILHLSINAIVVRRLVMVVLDVGSWSVPQGAKESPQERAQESRPRKEAREVEANPRARALDTGRSCPGIKW